MSNTSSYNKYSSQCVPDNVSDQPVWCFVFNAGSLLVKVQNGIINVPVKLTLEELKAWEKTRFYLGRLNDCDCYCIETDENAAVDKAAVPEEMIFKKFRSLFGRIDEEIFMLAGKAAQILDWHKKSQYCGSCGSKTETKQDELAKVCLNCSNIIYPKISPAIIVAVINGDKILLAKGRNFKFYSLIAGFAEPGETLEDCVQREVFEEVGIRIRNIQYFGSQPWPFPDSLMIGFTAEYESGELLVDGNEIVSADWFTKESLPEVPNNSSIAGKIIDWFCDNS